MVRKKERHEMDDAMITRAAKDYLRDSDLGQTDGIPQDYLWDVMDKNRRDPHKLVHLPGGQERFQNLGERVVAKIDDLKDLDQQR